MKLSNGDVVVPLFGHLLGISFLSPEHKAAKLETFFDFLPIVVKDFKYEPNPERLKNGDIKMADGKPVPSRQFKIVSGLMRSASEIVNAGDIDREGQLIVDELLMYCGIDPCGKDKPIWRLPLVSDREDEIRAQVLDLKEKNGDKKWLNKRYAAMARSYCDAAVGFNGSMAYQAATGYRRASVGRVQTPVLSLVVDRELQINNFKPVQYYVPIITLADGTEMRFHKREDAQGQPGFDEEGRIIDEQVAHRMCSIISSGMKGRIKASKMVKGSEAPPLPFSATVLASTVSKRTGMTPKEAEEAAQSLYERHKAISYVGTDCRFFSKALLDDAHSTMAALSRIYPQQASGANLNLRSKAWVDANDPKIDEHTAIAPTGKLPQNATANEKLVYDAVAKRFMAQFYPAHEFMTSQLQALFGADEFRATKKETLRMGWKEIEGHLEQGGPQSDEAEIGDIDIDADTEKHRHKETQQ